MCSLVISLGVELEKTFGLEWLINHLSRLGLCISYDEVQKFNNDNPEFVQWMADNADHNLVTLTGKGTFHGMGVISVTQLAVQQQQNQRVLRLKQRKPLSCTIFSVRQVKVYQNCFKNQFAN